jgi:hypothetical protein
MCKRADWSKSATVQVSARGLAEGTLKRKAIILHEQLNKGITVIEKFENYSTQMLLI